MVSTQRFIYYKCNNSDKEEMTEIIKTVNEIPQSGLGLVYNQISIRLSQARNLNVPNTSLGSTLARAS